MMFCIVAVAVAVTVSAFAAVQNVKVSGDLALRNLNRKSFDMGPMAPGGVVDPNGRDDQHFLMNTARVRIDADLTDNVSTVVRLVNERDWDSAVNTYQVGVDTAYVTLKEFFYAPLTLTIGRQPIWWGKGFVVGSNGMAWDPAGSILANEYTSFTNFDAVRATLDYAPWTVDSFYSKLVNNATATNEDDVDVVGINVGYKFAEYNAESEAYVVNIDRHGLDTTDGDPQKTTTFGLRGSMDPLANISLWAEGDYQIGHYNPAFMANSHPGPAGAVALAVLNTTRERKAWACDVGGEYRFSDYAWKPKLGGEYILYSGDSAPWQHSNSTYRGWDPVLRGKYDTAIHEFQGRVYRTYDEYDPAAFTNRQQFAIFGVIKPLDTVAVNARYTHIRLHKGLGASDSPDFGPPTSRSSHIGDEVDANLTYDYTEDVQFGLLGAIFLPGKYYDGGTGRNFTSPALGGGLVSAMGVTDGKGNKTASSLVGTVKVTF